MKTAVIENDELNNTRLNGDEIVLRTPENMKDYVNGGIANQYSLHNMKTFFENICKQMDAIYNGIKYQHNIYL